MCRLIPLFFEMGAADKRPRPVAVTIIDTELMT